MRFQQLQLLLLLHVSCVALSGGDNEWPQFRGPHSSGVAAPEASPPVEFRSHMLWKRELPAGHSSPVVWGTRVFLTAVDAATHKLELICVSAKTGAILWRQSVTAKDLEVTHVVSNPATASPAVDADRVYAYFSSYGVLAFNHEGVKQWDLALTPPKTHHGSGASPVLGGKNLLIVNHDAMQEGYLLAIDRGSGKQVWRTAYPARPGRVESYSSAAISRDSTIVLHRAGLVESYSLATGELRWSLPTATSGLSTPIVDHSSGAILVSTWNNLGEPDQRPVLPDLAAMVKEYDRNGDGKLDEAEFPADHIKYTSRPELDSVPRSQNFVAFRSADRNKDGFLDEAEWAQFRTRVANMTQDHGMIAIREEGDNKASIVWRESTSIPEVPSPLLYQGRLYLVRNGGVLSCLDAATGKVLYRARLGAPGVYFASPVAAAGRVYLASGEGAVAVIDATKDQLTVMARNNLEEEIVATPALAGKTIFVRTAKALYAFGQ